MILILQVSSPQAQSLKDPDGVKQPEWLLMSELAHEGVKISSIYFGGQTKWLIMMLMMSSRNIVLHPNEPEGETRLPRPRDNASYYQTKCYIHDAESSKYEW